MAAQLEIPGIGQQRAKLADWKQHKGVYTHKSWGEEDLPWSAWSEIESAHDFGHTYGFDSMGRGDTEKEAIISYCQQESIALPFWWR